MASATKVTVVIQTKLLRDVTVEFYVPSTVVNPADPIIVGIVAAIEALISAYVVSITISLQAAHSGTFTTGAYNTAQDRAMVSIADANGRPHNYRLTAPKPSLFTADTVSLNVTAAPLSTLLTAIAANATAQDGVTAMGSGAAGFREYWRRELKR